MEGRREGGRKANITRIFLVFAEDLLFLYPWARDCREFKFPRENPRGARENPLQTGLPEYFVPRLLAQV